LRNFIGGCKWYRESIDKNENSSNKILAFNLPFYGRLISQRVFEFPRKEIKTKAKIRVMPAKLEYRPHWPHYDLHTKSLFALFDALNLCFEKAT
jgi:hypothetical protein